MTGKKQKKQGSSGKPEARQPKKQAPRSKRVSQHPDTQADRKDTLASDSPPQLDITAKLPRATWEQLRALSENLADCMLYQVHAGPDGSTRQFTYVSPAVERFHSITADALLKDASLLYSQIVPEDRVLVAEQERRAFAERKKLDVEVRVRMQSGRIAWRRFTSSPRQGADGIWVWDGIEVDITERKEAEEALRESERRYRAIVESQSEFVARHLPRGILTFVNDTLCRYANMRKEDLLGLSFHQFIHPEDLPGLIRKIESLTRSNPAMTAESRVILPDGRRAWHRWTHHAIYDETGAFVEYQCTGRDVTEFKQMEEALMESERKYKFLVEATGTGFVILDNKGQVLDANDEYVRMTGHRKRKEILGRNVVEWTAPHDRDRNAAEVKKCLELGYVKNLEIDYAQTDGTIVAIEIDATVMGTGDAMKVFTLCRDISDRKKAEKEIAERGALVQQIMDTASAGIALVDMRGRFTHANRRMAELFGCPMDELIGSDYVDHVHPSEQEAARKNMFALLESSIPSVDIERYYVKKDGTVFWGHLSCNRFYDAQGRELGLIGVITDITGRKRVEHELLLSRQWLSLHVQQTPLAVVEFDLDGRIRGWNPAAATIFGFPREEAVGQHWHFIVPPEVRGSLNGVWEGLVSQRGGSRSANKNITKDGRLIDCEWFNTPLVGEDGETIGVASLVMDVTERRNAEEALRKSEERFQLALQGANDGLWDWDLSTDEVFYSPRWKSMLGYAPDELEHTLDTWKSLVHPEDRERTLGAVRSLAEGQSDKFEVEFRMRHRDGSFRHILSRAFLADTDKGKAKRLVGTHVDITERKRAEEALRHSHELMQYVISHAQSAIAVHDRDMKYIYVSDQYLKQYKIKEKDVIGRHHYEVFPDLPQKWRDVHQRVLAGAVEGKDEDPYVREDGTVDWTRWECRPWYEHDGSIGGLIVYTEVITEWKRREEALRESSERLNLALQGGRMGVWRWEIAEDHRYFDDLTCRLLGIDPAGFSGSAEEFFGAVHPEDHAKLRAALDHTMSTRVQYEPEYRVVWPDGSVHYISARGKLDCDDQGRPLRISGIIWDTTERKAIEHALQESEERLRGIFEGMVDGILIADTETRKFVDTNSAFCAMLGYSREEVLALSVTDIHPAKDLPAVLDAFEWQACGESTLASNIPMLRKDGSVFYVDVNASLVQLGGRRCLVGMFRDISDRKLAETALRESEARYRDLFDSSTDGIFILDMDGNFLDANRTAYERLGYTRGEFLSLNIRTLDDPRFAPNVPERLRQIRENGIAVFESGHRRKDGTMMPVEVNSRLFTYQGRQVYFSVIRDITSRKEAEEKIRQSEKFIRSILDTVDEGFIVIDRDYRILTANKAYCGQAGRSCEDIIGRHCYEVSHNIDRPCYEEGEECAVRQVFETGRPQVALHKHRDLDGHELFVETKAYPIADAHGNIMSVIETINNITERHLLEEERLKTQKLESIGTLAGGIAHDFNNLLQGIFGYITLAKLMLDNREKASAMLTQAEEALHLTVNLTTQLLTFSKGGKPVKKPLSPRPLIESVVKFALSGSHSDFLMECDEGLWGVEADAGQLAQVIQNIVLNANEAMAGKGTVSVAVKNVEFAQGAYPGLPEGGKFIRIAISDTGIGISAQDLHRIFDPYFTTKQRGSGLGLATSYSIIRNHGGVIEVKSDVGRGSTFTIYLPASVEVVAETESPASGASGTTKGRVLLMDDEEMVRGVAREMIEALGHEVKTAADGGEAIALFREAKDAGAPFDLVILDLTVKGGMGGEEAIMRFREIDPGVVAVVSSGYADSPVMGDYRAYGFAAVLGKPYQIDSLGDCLASLIRKT